jgi:hypothetical protein
MKKTLLLFSVIVLAVSCNNQVQTKEPVAEPTTVKEEPLVAEAKKIAYPYEASFASDWKIGNPENAVIILNLYKNLESDAPVDSSLNFFADSLTSISFDDKIFKGSSKDFLKRVKVFREQFKSLDEEVISFVPLYSPSKNLDQVSIWIKEKGIRLNGKADSTIYQENWRFNSAGKINFRSAYARYSF